jgi:xanthine dehydrogenase YagS FAD-binding subunit
MCIALAALDATVQVEGPKGKREIKFTDFHRLPGNTPEKDNTLQNKELITSVEIPNNNFNKNVHYLKVRDRSSYAFALISVAAALDIQSNTINDVRLAMGGVAHKPWRLTEAEEFLKGKTVSETIFRQAADLAMKGARGYGDNDFKLTLGPNAIVEALTIASSK